MRRLTASNSAAWLLCAFARSDVVDAMPDDADDELRALRDDGNAMHKLIELDDGSTLYAEENCHDPRIFAARNFETALPNGAAWKEAAYGWDGTTSHYLGTGRESYAKRPGCSVYGTTDLAVIHDNRTGTVADWKAGEHGAMRAREQLLTLGALVLEHHGLDSVRIFSVWLDGTTPRVFDFGEMDALDASARLATLSGLREGEEATAGDHCGDHYCKARGRCPAFVAAAAQATEMVPVAELVRSKRNPLVEGIVDDETARIWALMRPLVEKRFEALEKDVRKYVSELPTKEIDTGDGRTWGPRPANFVNDTAALEAAKRVLSEEEIAPFVTTKTVVDIEGKKLLALAEAKGLPAEDSAACMIHKPAHSYAFRKTEAAKAANKKTKKAS